MTLKRFVALIVAILLASYAFAGGPTYLKSEQSLTVYTGDLVNLKMEFWLGDDFLVVERIAHAPNGGLELALYDGERFHYNYSFKNMEVFEPLFVVSKKCGIFDGCYRIKSWRNNELSLMLDYASKYPDNFRPKGTGKYTKSDSEF